MLFLPDDDSKSFGPREQEYLDRCRRFASEIIEPEYRKFDSESVFPAPIHEAGYEWGLMNAAIPEEFGGGGVPMRTVARGAEILASVCPGVTFSMMFNNGSLRPVLDGGTRDQKRVFVAELLERRQCASLCITEDASASSLRTLTTKAERNEDRWMLRGRKVMVGNGTESRLFLVLATAVDNGRVLGPTFFAVARDTPGLYVGENTDRLSFRALPTPSVTFDGVEVGNEHVIGSVGGALPLVMTTLDFMRLGGAPVLLGISQGSLRDALPWVEQRELDNEYLIDKSHVQIALGELYARHLAVRALIDRAMSLAEGGQRYSKEASAAKLLASHLAVDATATVVQLFGWRGIDSSFPIQKRFRDARQTTIFEGTSEVQCITLFNLHLRPSLMGHRGRYAGTE